MARRKTRSARSASTGVMMIGAYQAFAGALKKAASVSARESRQLLRRARGVEQEAARMIGLGDTSKSRRKKRIGRPPGSPNKKKKAKKE